MIYYLLYFYDVMKKLYIKVKDKIWWNNLFLLFVIFVFLFVLFLDFDSWKLILNKFIQTFFNILPSLLLVYLFILIVNILVSNKKIIAFLEHWSYFKKMILSCFLWILSTWPIYMRYWFLKDMVKKWLTLWHISTFSYSRAIKIPLLPMMIIYFWLTFTILFNVVLFVLSFFNWILIDKIMKKKFTYSK